MRGRYRTGLAAGVVALAVVGTFVGIGVLGGVGSEDTKAPVSLHSGASPSQDPSKDAEHGVAKGNSTGSDGEVQLKLTYIPDGFTVSARAQPRKLHPAASGVKHPTVRRGIHYNNLAAKDPSTDPAAFHVSLTTGDTGSLTQRKRRHPEGRWVRLGSRRALLQPPTPERSLTVITWNIDNARVQIVGRGMGPKALLPIARGVRVQ